MFLNIYELEYVQVFGTYATPSRIKGLCKYKRLGFLYKNLQSMYLKIHKKLSNWGFLTTICLLQKLMAAFKYFILNILFKLYWLHVTSQSLIQKGMRWKRLSSFMPCLA